MAGDLARPMFSDSGNDQVVAVEPHPNPGADQLMGHRVAHSFDQDGGVPAHPPCRAERDRERLARQRVQAGAFLSQRLDRRAAGLPVRTGVDLLAELPTGRLELREPAVLLEQVRRGGDQVSLRYPHRRLTTHRLRVRRNAGADGHPVVPPDRDDLRVAHRDPGNVIDADGALVVGQRVGPGPRPDGAGWCRCRLRSSVGCDPRPLARPGTVTRPATRTGSCAGRSPAVLRPSPSPSAATALARPPTARHRPTRQSRRPGAQSRRHRSTAAEGARDDREVCSSSVDESAVSSPERQAASGKRKAESAIRTRLRLSSEQRRS
jgi:hypothetical protein